VTFNDLQRGALVLYAARAAGPFGSLEQMKAIAYCMRNRVKAGWFDGQWLTVIEHATEADANMLTSPVTLDPGSRVLQRLVADIDDIYYGGRQDHREGMRNKALPAVAQRFSPEGGDLEEAIGKSCYWLRVNEPIRPWFKAQIMDHPEEHPNRANMGLIAFFE
jgi:hypothetical protein